MIAVIALLTDLQLLLKKVASSISKGIANLTIVINTIFFRPFSIRGNFCSVDARLKSPRSS